MDITHGGLFKQFIDRQGLTDVEVGRRLNKSSEQVSKYYETKKFRRTTLVKIKEVFPEFTVNYIEESGDLIPDGSNNIILNSENSSILPQQNLLHHVKKHENSKALSSLYFEYTDEKFTEISPGRYRMKVKYVDQKATAGYPRGFIDPEFIEKLKDHHVTVNVFHKGVYQAFEIDGDSMDDRTIDCIPHGTIVTCREIPYDAWRSKLHTHRWPNFVFVHRELGVMTKQIIEQDVENGKLTLHSLNSNKELYPDFTIEIDDLLQIFNIVARELHY